MDYEYRIRRNQFRGTCRAPTNISLLVQRNRILEEADSTYPRCAGSVALKSMKATIAETNSGILECRHFWGRCFTGLL